MKNKVLPNFEAQSTGAGRVAFRRYQSILLPAAKVLSLLPGWALDFIWSLVWSGRSRASVAVRYCIAKARLKTCGDCVYFGSAVTITGWEHIDIGSNVSIQDFCVVIGEGGVSIADDVSIAHASSLISANHTWEDQALPIRDNPVGLAGIRIEEDVWVGCGVRVLAGVVIGSRVAIGANSVVSKSLASGFLYVGSPAKVVRAIT